MKKHRIWKKTLGFILVGILIAIAFTLTDTYSLYQKSSDGYGEVVAATKEDIISNMEIYYHNHMPILRVEEGKNIDYSPIVFFSIEGDAKDYALHINSIKVDGIVEVPIMPNVNLPQALSLIISPKDEVTGRIRIKHLNEFLDDTLEFSFSKDYLLSRYFSNKNLETYDANYLSKSEKNKLVKLMENTLLYAKRYLEWDTVEWAEDNNWISKVDMAGEQTLLVDIIAPNLLEYNEKLYELFEILTRDLENEIEKNNALFKENHELEESVNRLEEEKGKLNNYIYTLELEIEQLLDRLDKKPVLDPEEPKTPEESETPEEPETLEEPEIPEEPEANI